MAKIVERIKSWNRERHGTDRQAEGTDARGDWRGGGEGVAGGGPMPVPHSSPGPFSSRRSSNRVRISRIRLSDEKPPSRSALVLAEPSIAA